ncbi:hypothetical protein SAMN05660413_02673 [Salegentibacter flavus]|uniref:Uncharacterized protein n=1 Tax=Salegentibacter flavus TaxID=287099 RepID=A0A1I5C2I4_9FLAO|nr:hypothetical protein SAMN05660413_02673 [Salegentibacter flavus]
MLICPAVPIAIGMIRHLIRPGERHTGLDPVSHPEASGVEITLSF